MVFNEGAHVEGWSSCIDTTRTEFALNGVNISKEVEYYKNKTIKYTAAYGEGSHAEGRNTLAINGHAEGYGCIAVSYPGEGIGVPSSHAEGFCTEASACYTHAEGYSTTASRTSAHAEGDSTIASGKYSHAEGCRTTASSNYSHAEGYSTIAVDPCHSVMGHFNANSPSNIYDPYNTNGVAFTIGNGTSNTAKSNAFSVMFNGVVKAKSTITASTTADYAEFFEWEDGNPDDEDRVGYFVTMKNDKIKICEDPSDYILGIVSGNPFVLGNGDCDTWNGMFLMDEFRRTRLEPAPKIEIIKDENGNNIEREIPGEYDGTRPILNPEYDNTREYISRFDRKEWDPVGMLGVLPVRHDGTAKVNGYVTVGKNGIATSCDRSNSNSWRVIRKNSDSVVEIVFR